VRIIADTNLLVRIVMKDDTEQWRVAKQAVEAASVVAVTLPALCELVWVLRRTYNMPYDRIVEAIEVLVEGTNVEINPSAVDAGLQNMRSGGDFADGVIAFEGQWIGGEVFTSFDKKAVRLLKANGYEAKLLTGTKT
jgi:predicted nucleic-acid-binding protein